MKLRPQARTSQQQSEGLRLMADLNHVFERVFIDSCKRFLKAKTEAETLAIKNETEALIREKMNFWKRVKGADAVSIALNALHLSEYDT